MKMRKAWEITTVNGDTLIVPNNDTGTIRWAKRHNATFRRIFVLS